MFTALKRNSCYALPHYLGAVGNATAAMLCLIAWGQWAVELLQCKMPAGEDTPLRPGSTS